MIGFMPELYEDELLYSVLSRYYARSGHLIYRAASEELFQNPKVRPDVLLVNAYKKEVIDVLGASMETLVRKHTMFPAYAMFLPYQRRKDAFHSLVRRDGKHNNLLAIPVRKKSKYLRYCPVCAERDRQQYGETYWHRTGQIQGVKVCPQHRCYLQATEVLVSGKATPAFTPAEEAIPETQEVISCNNELELNLAKYIIEVFQSKIDMENQVSVGAFLHTRLENTKYLSLHGEQRNIGKLHQDFTKYYRDLQDNDFMELWQIQKVLTNDRYRLQDVCMLAMFLQIPAKELVNRELPKIRQHERFEKELERLHAAGIKYPAIARQLGASYDTVKAIGEGRYKKKHDGKILPGKKAGVKGKDWEKLDKETLPLVQKAITEMWEDVTQDNRPMRITTNAVVRKMGVPSKWFEKQPRCKKVIEKYTESYPRYWAREVVWAVQLLQKRGEFVCWKGVRKLTNISKKNFLSCLEYVNEYTDSGTVALIQFLC
nr:TniQ family protein [uncultured Blautia sp.]